MRSGGLVVIEGGRARAATSHLPRPSDSFTRRAVHDALTLHRLQAEQARRAGQAVVVALTFGVLTWAAAFVTAWRMGWML